MGYSPCNCKDSDVTEHVYKGMEHDKCFPYKTENVKCLKNGVSLSVLCKSRRTRSFMAAGNWETLLEEDET